MKNKIELAKKIPFVGSYSSKLTKTPLNCKTVQRNLGANFYPRLVSIYNNLIEALIFNKSDYINKVSTPELSKEISERKSTLWKRGFKMKINSPSEKLFKFKNYFLPERVYRNDNFYISVACRVYFGGENKSVLPSLWPKEKKAIRFGKHRFFVWNTTKSIGENISNIFNNQLFEFVVKVQSNYYIKVYDSNEGGNYTAGMIQTEFDEREVQELVSSELVLLSDAEKFDWTLADINGIMMENK